MLAFRSGMSHSPLTRPRSYHFLLHVFNYIQFPFQNMSIICSTPACLQPEGRIIYLERSEIAMIACTTCAHGVMLHRVQDHWQVCTSTAIPTTSSFN